MLGAPETPKLVPFTGKRELEERMAEKRGYKTEKKMKAIRARNKGAKETLKSSESIAKEAEKQLAKEAKELEKLKN